MSRINTKDYPSLAWFDPTGKGEVKLVAPPGYTGPQDWASRNRPFRSMLVMLMSDCYVGGTYEERLTSRKIDSRKRHLQQRHYLADTIFERIDSDNKVRQRLWPLIDELPSQGGIVLFQKGGQYLYRICDVVESCIFLEDSTLFPQTPPLGSRFFTTCLLGRDVLCGFECGFIYQGQAYVSDTHSIYLLTSDPGQFISFVGTTLLFLRFAEVETKIVGPATGRRAHVNHCKYLNESNLNVQVVDSRWFTTLIRSEAFAVGGHFRLQPHGEGNKQRKLIWISDYQKQGYTRQAKVGERLDSGGEGLPNANSAEF